MVEIRVVAFDALETESEKRAVLEEAKLSLLEDFEFSDKVDFNIITENVEPHTVGALGQACVSLKK